MVVSRGGRARGALSVPGFSRYMFCESILSLFPFLSWLSCFFLQLSLHVFPFDLHHVACFLFLIVILPLLQLTFSQFSSSHYFCLAFSMVILSSCHAFLFRFPSSWFLLSFLFPIVFNFFSSILCVTFIHLSLSEFFSLSLFISLFVSLFSCLSHFLSHLFIVYPKFFCHQFFF